jgi:hypothetical protein
MNLIKVSIQQTITVLLARGWPQRRIAASGGGDVVQDWPFKNRTASGVQDLDVKKPAAIGPSAMARCN